MTGTIWFYVWQGTDQRNRIYYAPLVDKKLPSGDVKFTKLLDNFDAGYSFHNVGKTFYFKTDLDAPKGRVIAVDLDDGAAEKPRVSFLKAKMRWSG